MKTTKKKILQKCKKVELVLIDVDGVLTDGGRYYSKSGEELKKFHVRDGMGVTLLLRNGIKTGIITKEKSPITKKWARDMNINLVYSGIKKKEEMLEKICRDFSIIKENIAFIGDDVNDLELMKKVGFSALPSDGVDSAKKVVDYICKKKGGEGVLREIADLILSIKFPKKTNWY